VGQAKAYSTRVGAGPYPTEIHGPLAEELRSIGMEYGVTTGRPRRIGWLDIPTLRYATRYVLDTFLSGRHPTLPPFKP
jgi:adenylosuccinate synthase